MTTRIMAKLRAAPIEITATTMIQALGLSGSVPDNSTGKCEGYRTLERQVGGVERQLQ